MRDLKSQADDRDRGYEESKNSRSASDHAGQVSYHFADIGPVKEASLKLGPLTVIAGRNNTGKTYILHSLYGFLKTWRRHSRLSKATREIAETLGSSGRATMPLAPASILKRRRSLVELLSKAFSNELPQVVSSRRDSFRDSSFAIELDSDTGTSIPSPVKLDVAGARISIKHDGANLIVDLDVAKRSSRVEPTRVSVSRAYSLFLLGDLFPDPFILSAERFGISLFCRELDFTESQLAGLPQKLGHNEGPRSMTPYRMIDRAASRYALPIKDNIQFTQRIMDMPKDVSALVDEKLFDGVKNLIDGYYGNASDAIRFISSARGKGRRFNVPLHLASSSARGLSDLYFFLRHVAKEGHLLIIDGPESHLDTQNQVLFARLLGRCVTAGLRVLISTHSDYLVKELNNLIMLDRDFPDRNDLARKLGYRPDESLSPNTVRAYVAEDNGLTECEIGPFGIEMPVFDATIDRINEAAIELSSRATTYPER